jgi:predicted HTH domain antitoxin
MSTTLTTRIPDDLEAAIERISEEEQLDKSAVARRLLEQAVRDHDRERAFERYADGALSLEGLTNAVDMPLRQVLAELRERDIKFSYSERSLREDLPDA